ncbi:Arsenate reductase thioredoxin-coupled,LMWP family [Citrifermentans bremense]|uniref:Arsenate reductase thioredoxin-coupled,LMWP family n=1 Tax=Citrifermentans bremense TaxID=60035 RepID=A0A6S6M1T4_9BACT|nr:arsenate reductase ArsC [Citrifermentans bremense]BCG47450.1 Arsenate reductase thioredoxin-coupled,LMWP family [Citrifermentans bremense]
MQGKIRVLFVCIHNSARSQMGEAFLKQAGGERFEVQSAGIEPGRLNPLVVQAMKEVGIDISGNVTKEVSQFIEKGAPFDYVITVCDETSAERCPLFPGKAQRLHWGFPDPSALQGTDEEKLQSIRAIRDDIKKKVESWIISLAA